jgi:hypothetical protein
MSYGLTPGEKFLQKKDKKIDLFWPLYVLFIAFLIFMTVHWVIPALYPTPRVAIAPATNQEACSEIQKGIWNESYQVFKYCEQMTKS